jgi:hypothetical protein
MNNQQSINLIYNMSFSFKIDITEAFESDSHILELDGMDACQMLGFIEQYGITAIYAYESLATNSRIKSMYKDVNFENAILEITNLLKHGKLKELYTLISRFNT